MQYDFLNNAFTVYEDVPVTKLNLPLGDIDVSDFGYIGDNGIVYANNNLQKPQQTEEESKLVINHNPEQEIVQQSEVSNNMKQDLTGNKKKAMEFFQSKGLSAHQAAGIVGNLMVESGSEDLSRTDAVGDKNKGPNGSSYGIAQWRLDRRTALKNFAAKRGKPMSDFETQLEFIWDEINGSQKRYKVLEGLTNATSIEEATKNFMNTFERPNSDPKINRLDRRIKYAKSLLNG